MSTNIAPIEKIEGAPEVEVEAPDDRPNTVFIGVKVNEQGKIMSHVQIPIMDLQLNLDTLPTGWSMFESGTKYDAELYYVQSGELVERPNPYEVNTTLKADGADVYTLEVVPTTRVFMRVDYDDRGRYRHNEIDVTDGTFEFVSEVPGTYVFDVQPEFPMRTAVIRIEAE